MLYRWIIVLSFLGVLLSGYSLYAHYSPYPSTICNFSETFSCDAVNKSEYAELAGIPVALVGLGGYALLALLALGVLKGKTFHKDLCWFSLVGFLFSLYLTYLEAFVIHTWCPLCLLSQAVIFGILVLSLMGCKQEKKSHKYDETAGDSDPESGNNRCLES